MRTGGVCSEGANLGSARLRFAVGDLVECRREEGWEVGEIVAVRGGVGILASFFTAASARSCATRELPLDARRGTRVEARRREVQLQGDGLSRKGQH